jgi:hypothetical protein
MTGSSAVRGSTVVSTRNGFASVDPEYTRAWTAVRVRRHPRHAFQIIKELRIVNLKCLESFAVEGPSGTVALPPGRISWVDWDGNGRLVVLVHGTIRVASAADSGIVDAEAAMSSSFRAWLTRQRNPNLRRASPR